MAAAQTFFWEEIFQQSFKMVDLCYFGQCLGGNGTFLRYCNSALGTDCF